jgi:GT2 family glycosyltransferase
MTEIKKQLKVSVGLPSTGLVNIDMAVSLAALVSHTQHIMFQMHTPTGCYIHQNRELIALEALKWGADYLFFIDSDMIFPPDGLVKLLEHNLPIVGAKYNYRTVPLRSVIKLNPKDYPEGIVDVKKDFNDPSQQNLIATIKNPGKPFLCRAVGTGFMLIDMKVFKTLKQPWFFFRPMSDPEGMIGEDVWFCDRARESDFGVYCDPTIEVHHIGIGIY